MRNTYKTVFRKPEKRDSFGELDMYGILKWILNK
jgi:hypothetical protein